MNSFHNAIQFSDLQREWFFETEESRNRFVLDHISDGLEPQDSCLSLLK